MAATRLPVPLAVAISAAAAFLVALALIRAHGWTYGADTGTFAQLIFNTPGGWHDELERGSHLRFHFSPSLGLLYPIVALTHSALSLQIVEIVAVLGSVAVFFLLVEPHAGRPLATRLSLLMLAFPSVPALAFGEFRELTLFPLAAMLVLLAADRRRWGWYAVFTLFALGLREDVALELALFAVVAVVLYARTNRERTIAALCTFAGSAAVLAAYFLLIAPALGGWAPSHFYQYAFAGGPLALAVACVLHPVEVTRAIATPGRLTYLLEIFVPLAFLPLRTRWWLLALPGLAIVLLANSANVWRMGMHYTALWLPSIFVAVTAAAIAVQRTRGQRSAQRWVTSAIALSIGFLLFADPMHLGHYLPPSYHDLASARRALACVPASASVSMQGEWYAANSIRWPRATTNTLDGVQYAVFADDYPNVEYQQTIRPQLAQALARGQFKEICRFGAVAAYSRER